MGLTDESRLAVTVEVSSTSVAYVISTIDATSIKRQVLDAAISYVAVTVHAAGESP